MNIGSLRFPFECGESAFDSGDRCICNSSSLSKLQYVLRLSHTALYVLSIGKGRSIELLRLRSHRVRGRPHDHFWPGGRVCRAGDEQVVESSRGLASELELESNTVLYLKSGSKDQ